MTNLAESSSAVRSWASGQLLGYGYADHLPQPVTQSTQSVLNPGDDNEPLFPSPSDIVNGQYLFRPESNDMDLYRFTLSRSARSTSKPWPSGFAARVRSTRHCGCTKRRWSVVGRKSRQRRLLQR